MIRLTLVELTRLRWRRAVLVLAALAVGAGVAVFAGSVATTGGGSLEELAAKYGPAVTQEYDDCVARRSGSAVPLSDDAVAARCLDQVRAGWSGPALDLVDQREGGGAVGVIALVTLALLLAGTTFVGHDWNTGSISNQLLFEPRRARVWGAKLAAVALSAGVLMLVVTGLYWTGLHAVAASRDLRVPEHAMAAAYKQVVLASLLASGAAALGYALTMLLRSTVATLGLLFAVGFLGIVMISVLGLGSSERFMPWSNFMAFIVGSYTYYPDDGYYGCYASDGGGCHLETVLHRSDGTVYFLVVLGVVGALSWLSFQRRDLP